MFERRNYEQYWQGRMEPFKIVGNVYFVGCFSASTHLIDTGDGLILIDPGYTSTLHLVVDGIYRLGFRPEQIKYIINTHWHSDHTLGTAALAHLSGAKTLLGREDVELAAKYFVPDILVKDGDTLTLGNTTISFMETPGHTKGTISFFFDTQEGDKIYRVGTFGGAAIAIAIIFIQFVSDDRVRNAEMLQKRLGLATLGMVPVQENAENDVKRNGKGAKA